MDAVWSGVAKEALGTRQIIILSIIIDDFRIRFKSKPV